MRGPAASKSTRRPRVRLCSPHWQAPSPPKAGGLGLSLCSISRPGPGSDRLGHSPLGFRTGRWVPPGPGPAGQGQGRRGQGHRQVTPFFWKAYLPIENTLNGKRPRLVHGPRAGPTPGGQKAMVRCHAWDLRRMINRSAGVYRDSEALVRVLLWAGFYRRLLKLLSNFESRVGTRSSVSKKMTWSSGCLVAEYWLPRNCRKAVNICKKYNAPFSRASP
jgi:hypothetical protein